MSSSSKHAFTLIELLVVVAIIALLISILLPSLQGAREQGKRATCLSNMGSIGKGAAAYSTEDRKEHAVPIQQQQVSTKLPNGFPDAQWALKTALPFSYGGRTAVVPFPAGFGSASDIMMKPNGRWAARTRPLNRYLYGASGIGTQDATNMPLYRCPSDTGYPGDPFTGFVREAPGWACHGIPLYDMMGNSYRFSISGVYWGGLASFSIAPWGHRQSTLVNTGRVANFMEPLFYTMTYQATLGFLPRDLLLRGWHKALMTANVVYADGSCRQTRVQELYDWDVETLRKMNYYNPGGDTDAFLRKGESWQMECYPTPGAYIPKYDDNGNSNMDESGLQRERGWPFTGYQNNLRYEG